MLKSVHFNVEWSGWDSDRNQ